MAEELEQVAFSQLPANQWIFYPSEFFNILYPKLINIRK